MPKFKSELSRRNKYRISKHRYLELKHFCLQYYEWKQRYNDLSPDGIGSSGHFLYSDKEWSDPTGEKAVRRADYAKAMDLVERSARLADDQIWNYIFKAVTENLSFTNLKSNYKIPCERDMYYDRYRRFFWILSQEKGV